MGERGVRVLAVDGGGVFGAIPAEVLAGLERAAGRPVSSMFDLLVGTSVGGLIALLLACPREGQAAPRHAAAEVAELFSRHAARMFERRPLRRATCPALALGALYRAETMEGVLREYLGEVPMRAALTRTAVTALDMLGPSLVTLRSEGSGPLDGAVGRMWEAARAATAAPTYFDPVVVRHGLGSEPAACLIDAGVCVNNPALVALQEAARLGLAGPLRILSLGCGARRPALDPDRLARWPRVRWICPLLSLMTESSGPVVDAQMRGLAAAGLARYLRVEADLAPHAGLPASFDDCRKGGLKAAREAGRMLFALHRGALEEFLA